MRSTDLGAREGARAERWAEREKVIRLMASMEKFEDVLAMILGRQPAAEEAMEKKKFFLQVAKNLVQEGDSVENSLRKAAEMTWTAAFWQWLEETNDEPCLSLQDLNNPEGTIIFSAVRC